MQSAAPPRPVPCLSLLGYAALFSGRLLLLLRLAASTQSAIEPMIQLDSAKPAGSSWKSNLRSMAADWSQIWRRSALSGRGIRSSRSSGLQVARLITKSDLPAAQQQQ